MARLRYAYTCIYHHPGSASLFRGDGTIMPTDGSVENVTMEPWVRRIAHKLPVRAGEGKPPPPCCGPGLEGL